MVTTDGNYLAAWQAWITAEDELREAGRVWANAEAVRRGIILGPVEAKGYPMADGWRVDGWYAKNRHLHSPELQLMVSLSQMNDGHWVRVEVIDTDLIENQVVPPNV